MEERMIECSVCYYRAQLARFTPITVSADFAALECPNCLSNSHECFRDVDVPAASRKAA